MTIQYLRKAALVVGVGNALIDLSDMHFVFSVQASYLASPNTAIIRVYNLSSDTARKITDAGTTVFLAAGYEGNMGQIFSGDIIQVRNGSEDAVNTFMEISAATGNYVYKGAFVNYTIDKGRNIADRLGVLAKAANIPLGTVSESSPDQATRGRVYFGLARDHLRNMASTMGAVWSINDTGLDMISQNAYKPGDIPVLNAGSGVIGIPEQTHLGISIKLLLNPSIQQNQQVQLDNSMITSYLFPTDLNSLAQAGFVPPISKDGFYKVLFVNHEGDTRGDDWYTNITCYNIAVNTEQLKYLLTNTIS
jgi:hypothetical protein